jgi:predicted Zn-ribbon and HTH transcriptional regulator
MIIKKEVEKMAECGDCRKEMTNKKTESCSEDFNLIQINKKAYARNTEYFDVNERCHDCGIVNKKGNLHHFGCDMERCPKCRGQLISCNCKKGFIGRAEWIKRVY